MPGQCWNLSTCFVSETGDDPNQKSTNQGGDFFNEQKVPRQKLMT